MSPLHRPSAFLFLQLLLLLLHYVPTIPNPVTQYHAKPVEHEPTNLPCPPEYFRAARDLDCEGLRSLLYLHPDCVQATDPQGRTAAMWLAGNNRHSANANKQERSYVNGKAGFCALILESFNASLVHVHDEHGNTAVSWAATNGMAQLLETLLEVSVFKHNVTGAGTKSNILETIEKTQHATPLHIATAHNHYDTVQLLLQHGANARHADINGLTPLMKATINQRRDIMHLFLEQDHDSYKDVSHTLWTPCHYAVYSKNVEAVYLLIHDQSCPLEAKDKDGRTPYALATALELEEISILLRDAKLEAIDRAHQDWADRPIEL